MNRLFLITLSALALGGCALMDKGPEPAASIQGAALGLAATQVEWPDEQWWRRYGDAQLDALVDEALAGSPSMTAAQARLAQANAAIGRARAGLYPSVEANYALTRQHYSKNYLYPAPIGGSVGSDNRLALDFSYEIDFWGKHRSEIEAAVSRAQAARADAQAARVMLAAAVVRSYLNLQDAYAQRDVLDKTIAQRGEIVQITRDRYAAGLDTQVEVKQAESALSAARVERTQTEARIASLRNQAAALAGAGPERGQALRPVALARPATGVPGALPLELLGRRADVVAARWRAQAALGDIASAKADFYPNVNLTAFLGFMSLSTATLVDSGSRIAGIGPAVSLPLFEGGRLNANLAGRRAERDLAVADYNQAVLDAVRQVADAVDAIRLLERETAEQRQAREAIEAAYDLAVRRYRAGLGNYLSVLLAQNDVLTQARLDTALQVRAYQLDAELAAALGGGYAEPPDAAAPDGPGAAPGTADTQAAPAGAAPRD